jgi:hypothetical protein
MISWGVISASFAFVPAISALFQGFGISYFDNARTFYFLRFIFGAAEAGFFPGIILYLTSARPSEKRTLTKDRLSAGARSIQGRCSPAGPERRLALVEAVGHPAVSGGLRNGYPHQKDILVANDIGEMSSPFCVCHEYPGPKVRRSPSPTSTSARPDNTITKRLLGAGCQLDSDLTPCAIRKKPTPRLPTRAWWSKRRPRVRSPGRARRSGPMIAAIKRRRTVVNERQQLV